MTYDSGPMARQKVPETYEEKLAQLEELRYQHASTPPPRTRSPSSTRRAS